MPPMYQYFSVQDSAKYPTVACQRGHCDRDLAAQLTVGLQCGIGNRMYDSLNGCDASDMSMEDVEGREAPAGQPQEYVIPSRKHPQDRQVGVANDASSICNVSPCLNSFRIARTGGQSLCEEVCQHRRLIGLTRDSARRSRKRRNRVQGSISRKQPQQWFPSASEWCTTREDVGGGNQRRQE